MNQSASKPAVGFIGLGIMGASMAARLAAAGYPLHVYNRTRAKAEPLIEAGASWHATPKALAEASDVVITIVGMPDDVRALYLGDDGLIMNARRDAVLIDMTTSSPQLAEELAAHAATSGVHMLDAPVSGGDVGAREGRLSIMVGGAADVLARVEPMLRCLGTNIVLQGGPGAGQHTKLCNQIVIASTMLGVCEGLAYAHSAGLNAQTVLSAIGGGAAGGFQLNNMGPRIAKGDFAPGFFIEHFIKDMRIAHEEAAHMRRELPGLDLVRSLYQKLAEQGFTRNGTQALFKLYER
ncbi:MULTISPECIES: NAD(P)-dependent oxidoreductase [Paraburkholderia]|uniref:NAD-binding protein n=1 Tax=Paraburkholderia madseniana TaxID=2599607 RepID=A0A6N6W6Y6_9BURK|nr:MULTISPECIES: NAD(P)-dependent oxidoreductase [Paraburkholderia]KAE8756437.1 NAD-binding protein [Paraburkholderia madseniana]MCX4169906.1 NAD(P)-dependent oxidoreductase [Paraburkholderia madseniana]MDQ6457918.1 NAD(P)-dependent oxidoreductase [Paraburkholderia madseniana]NPT64722.1 NAD-binding protein [Paraburkholderia madseniana]